MSARRGSGRATSGPLVSVLVPVYNGARFLETSLRSAEKQSHRNLEVLVRDDGSSDASREIVRAFCTRDRRFRLIDDDGRRLGGTGNMVELLHLASGEFVKYLHQDDLLEPTCVERLVRPLRYDPSLTMATSSRCRIDESGQPAPTTHPGYHPLLPVNAKLPGVEVIRRMMTTTTNQLGEPSVALFRNGIVVPDRAFVLDDVTYSYINDMALWTNLLLAGGLYWHAAPLSSFRAHGGQRSAQLAESITAGEELAHFARFGLRHGFLSGGAEAADVARRVSGYLGDLHAQLSAAPPAEQAELVPALAEAVAATKALLASRSGDLVGAADR